MSKLSARVITLDAGEESYLRVLGGPPGNESLRSGMVKLKPGESVGAHCTDEYEELIVVLHGRGEASISDGEMLSIRQGTALYIPPWTDHNIKNTGTGTLTYLYVVAKTSLGSGPKK
jgi:mannose-6-phosphate isomerase-like protein (cupin superfamily)